MNLNEILKAQGIADETITAILEAMKANKVYTASEENLDTRYAKLKTQHDGVTQQLTQANTLIGQLKAGTVGQEAMQQKLTEYEQKTAQMQQELEKTKVDAAVKVALLYSKAVDVDYLTFKLREKLGKDGESITLDENGEIKGWKDKLEGLKTQFPNMFEAADGGRDGLKVWKPNELKGTEGGKHTPSREEFKGMSYEQRLALKNENPELFKRLAY